MKKIQIFVPGRLCLFGEHSDWAGEYRAFDPSLEAGHCIAIGANQGINAIIQPHPSKFIMTSILPTGEVIGPHSIDMNEDELSREAKKGGFFSYSAGVAYYFRKEYDVGGLIIHNRMNLPIKRGLSSSAAACVLTARAFNQIYALGLTIREQMEYAYLGETFAGSECGRMDQVCAYGRVPVFLTFDGDTMDVEKLSPQKPIYMVIVDLKAGKDTRKILSDLNQCFKHGREADVVSEGVRTALGLRNKEILFRAKQAINEGDSRKVGELMVEAQKVFDEFVQPACPEELTAPKLHQVLRYPKIKHLIWGGKGVGSQGDGSAQFVAKGEKEREELMEIFKELDVECFKLNIEAIEARGQGGKREGG
jgi:galactokinase